MHVGRFKGDECTYDDGAQRLNCKDHSRGKLGILTLAKIAGLEIWNVFTGSENIPI